MKVTETGIGEGGIPLIRCVWPDGVWWDLESALNWGTAKRIRKVVSEIRADNSDHMNSAYEAQAIRVYGSTVGWSFKLPVTEGSLDRIADWRIRDLLDELTSRQRENAEVATDEAKKVSRWLWFSRVPFRLRGRLLRRT